MQKVFLVVSVLIALSFVGFAAGFAEDFSDMQSVNLRWEPFGDPSPSVRKVVNGREDVFENNGDGWCESGVYSEEWFDFSNGGV
ncbi:MAG TPA: hypothetical protein P5560_14285, partial [Thermotogota bacterium]|nr:hypothetical protein [Thermotogota bacterium]HRW94118.1 hypothetical protein [Thermotogota bacterium]